MNKPNRKIEVDEATAKALELRAAEKSVAELVSELISHEQQPVAISEEELAELDRRWAAIEAGEPTVPHEEVAKWLRTWGTPEYKPWPER